jgi:hypothetical protein
VEVTSPSTSTTSKSAQIACPSGKRLMGGGARVNGGIPEVSLTASFPDTDNIYRATAVENDTFNPAWTLTVYAICAVAS